MFCRGHKSTDTTASLLEIQIVVRAHLVSQDYGRIVHVSLGSAHCIDYDYMSI